MIQSDGRTGSVTYVSSSSSDEDSVKGGLGGDGEFSAGDLLPPVQRALSQENGGSSGVSSGVADPSSMIRSIESQEQGSSSLVNKKRMPSVPSHALSGNIEFSLGMQVLFLPTSEGLSEVIPSTGWELGRIVQFIPSTSTTKKEKKEEDRIDDDGDTVVLVERVSRGKPLCGSRVHTTLRSLQRYSYEGSPLDLNDVCTLHELSEAALLYSLRERYFGGLHYTFTGRVLLAVNPYQRAVYPPHCAHPKQIVELVKEALCVHKGHHGNGECAASELDMVSSSYSRPVALIVTGGSGAGKTETAKIVLQHLLSHREHNSEGISYFHETPPSLKIAQGSMLLHILEEVNCLLESLGNALTPLNDNSSRFAKCTSMFLNPFTGEGVGAKVEFFFLEVSRLVTHLPGESNFHIFSMLFDEKHGLTPEERDRFHVREPNLFRAMRSTSNYLSLSSPPYTLSQFRVALRSIGFNDDKVEAILRVLCGILHLLNVEFVARDVFSAASISPASVGALEKASELLGFSLRQSPSSLHVLLTTVRVGKDVRELHSAAAESMRDSTAKYIYESLFRYILCGINGMLLPPNTEIKTESVDFTILDIFGFEVKDERCGNNDLEQLLINYANEAVQRLYEETTFDNLVEEASHEGVPMDLLLPKGKLEQEEEEHRPSFDLLVRRPQGVLNVINDDTLFGQRSRREGGAHLAELLASLQEFFPGLVRRHQFSPSKVSLQHFSATVVYDTCNMSSKNRISTAAELICRRSSDPFIQEICDVSSVTPIREGGNEGDGRGFPLMGNNDTNGLKPRTYATTLITQFRSQIEVLMAKLKSSNLFWIRCIKSNRHKSPQEFDSALVLSQIKCDAILRSLILFGQGYCQNLDYKSFAQNYLSLAVRGHCCFDALQESRCRKYRGSSGSRGDGGKKNALPPFSDKQTQIRSAAYFYEAFYRASFREACIISTEFIPCCMGGALLIGSSKVFLRSSTLQALLSLGNLAKEEAIQYIERVGRAFIVRRSLSNSWLSYINEKRLSRIQERIAEELPRRAALEEEREAMLMRSSERRADNLAFLSRQAMGSLRRVERHWKDVMHVLTSELNLALGEVTLFDKARLEKENEVHEKAVKLESYRRRIRESMGGEKRNRKVEHRRLLELRRGPAGKRDGKTARRSDAGIDAERERAIREEIIKDRQLQLRVEQEVLLERRERESSLHESRAAREARLYLDRQQKRIANRVRLREEIRQRHVASQLYLQPSQSLLSLEAPSLSSLCRGTASTANESVKDFGMLGGLVTTSHLRVSQTSSSSHIPVALPIQGGVVSSNSSRGDYIDPEVEWAVQKDVMTVWESLQNGMNT